MTSVLTEIVQLLVGGISGVAQGIGTGVNALVTDIFVVTEGSTKSLSTFGAIIAVFGGIALAIGLSRWVMNFLTSLGAKK